MTSPPPRVFLSALLFVAACLFAGASTGADVVLLVDGTKYTGTVTGSSAGHWSIRLADGSVVEVPYAKVERIDLAPRDTEGAAGSGDGGQEGKSDDDAYDFRRSDDKERDDRDDRDERDDRDRGRSRKERSGVGGGFEVGTVTSGRLRFYIPGKAVHHVDIRLGAGLGLTRSSSGYAYVGLTPFAGAELGFFDAPVHLAVSLALGPALITSSFTSFSVAGLFVGTGLAVQIDTGGPFEMNFGVMAGPASLGYTVIIPDLAFGFVW